MITYYWICFLASVVIAVIYVYLWHEHINVYNTCMFVLIPIVNLGFLWLANAHTLQSAFYANCVTYLGACLWPPFATFSILSLCDIKITKKISVPAYILSLILYGFVLTSDKDGVFYKNLSFTRVHGVTVLVKENGFMHTVVEAVVAVYAIAGIAVLIYCIVKNRRASLKNMYILLATEVIAVLAYLFTGLIVKNAKPAAVYTLSELIFLLVSNRSYYYYVNEAIMDTIVRDEALGYLSFDYEKRLLACNPVAERWFPELCSVRIDEHLDNHSGVKGLIADWFFRIDDGEKQIMDNIDSNGTVVSVNMQAYKMSFGKTGYRIIMRDTTDHQKLMNLLSKQRVEAEKERRRVSETFERYIDPSVAKAILQEGSEAVSKGRECEISILFADIRNFTSLSEGRSPSDVFDILNRCLDTLSACVMQNRGTIDKFMGDCLMAIWNAPTKEPDAAYLAAKTAVDMHDALKQLNAELKTDYGIQLSIGIGINYGFAIVGNAGTQMRSDYTAIGDSVNIASRLESVAGPGEILTTRSIAEQIEGRAEFEAYGFIKLKGKEKTIEVLKLKSVGGRLS